VHLPLQGVATSVEWRAGGLLCELLGLSGEGWLGRTFTTGATASNVLGLACGREAALGRKIGMRMAERGDAKDVEDDVNVGVDSDSVGELGLLKACLLAGVSGFQVLTTMGHSSLSKAASIVGLGRKSVIDVGLESVPWMFDMEKLERMLARPETASIVVVSCGEVNTGRYATSGVEEMRKLRGLCDRFGAWLHVDGGSDALFLIWS
jgi:glutamate/tyrosine decarboxylase-like PLP-dependent enzyme